MAARCQWIAQLVAVSFVVVGGANRAESAIQSYAILDTFSTSGFSASWVHSATSAKSGSDENGARMNGKTTSRVTGTLTGNLVGNVLSSASGNVSGTLKQLSVFLNAVFSQSYTMSTPFELLLGGQSNGGNGALQFETSGSGTGKYTGGYLDFSLFVNGSLTSLVDGTFFFKPQAESGNAALSPNRGTSSEFTLWGANWMHDGAPMDGAAEPDWTTFLAGLGYSGPSPVLRQLPSGAPGVPATLGIDVYAIAIPGGHVIPEPVAASVWGLLVLAGVGWCGPRRAFGVGGRRQ